MKKQTLLAIPLLMSCSLAFAQKEKYGADSASCVQNLSVYSEFYKQKNFEDAYNPWNWVFINCPASSMYIYTRGVDIIEYKMNNTKQEEVRQKYIDTLMLIYDKRIENFGKKGFVLGRKGADMMKYRSSNPENAFEILKQSVEISGNESEAGALTIYFQSAVLMLKDQKIAKDKVLEIFDKVSSIIDYNIVAESDEKKRDFYARAKENVVALFEPLASCEDLVKLYADKYETNKGDAGWLKKAAQMLNSKNCTDAPVFIKIAETLHALDPSAESAYNIAKVLTAQGQHQKAAKFYQQAVELQQDNMLKSEYYLSMAGFYFSNLNQQAQARDYALKAASLRSGWGAPYIAIGDMYASAIKDCGSNDFENSAIYWFAVDKYIKAKSVDASIAEDANKKIATYSKYFPLKKDAFFYNYTDGQTYTISCWINETTTVRVQ